MPRCLLGKTILSASLGLECLHGAWVSPGTRDLVDNVELPLLCFLQEIMNKYPVADRDQNLTSLRKRLNIAPAAGE